MTSRRHRSTPALMALTLAAAMWGARDARAAAKIERHLELGELIAKGFSNFDARPILGGGVTGVWSPLPRLAIGLEAGLSGTWLPYTQSDGPAKLSGGGNRGEDVTLLPRVMVGPRFVPAPNVSLGVSVGWTWLWSEVGSDLLIIPYPTASAGAQIKFGADNRYGVRAAFSYMYYWFGHGRALVGPTLAFTWGN